MGCICSKGGSPHSHTIEKESKVSKKSAQRLISSSRQDDVGVEVDGGGNDATTRLISTESAEVATGTTPPPVVYEKPKTPNLSDRRPGVDVGVSGQRSNMSRILSMRNGVDGAQVAAGWPSWLTNVAGEAIKGWIPRKADSFEKLDKIGQGTYSTVYRAHDLETGKIVALKKVRFVNMDPESVRFMAREILILRRLDHPNIMKLEGLVTSRVSGSLYLVFEYMEHDLTGLAASPMVKFTEPQIKCYMQQLLRGLAHCHSRGILHRDIKGSNLLIGNNGNLKIADFGLANFYHANKRQPLTSRVITLWYRPPELLLGATNYGVAVDLWSAGCILAELYAGKPIMPGRTEVEQLHKIFKLCGSPSEEYWQKSKLPHATIFRPQHPYERCFADTYKDFPPPALSLLDTLLAVEPDRRGSTSSALQSEYFTAKPLPCDPSTLPKYPPSKEFDMKLRDEEARRQKAAGGGKGRGHDSKRENRESKAMAVPNANVELQTSIQKRQGRTTPTSTSESYNREGDSRSGFPTKGPLQHGYHHGRVMNLDSVGSSRHETEFKSQRSYRPHGAAASQLSQFSNSVAGHGSSRLDLSKDNSASSKWSEECPNVRYNNFNDSDLSHHLLDKPNSSYRKDEVIPQKETTVGYVPRKNRIHYSGPLLTAGGNIEEMLKEHERQIQNAVRKAILDKTKKKNGYTQNGQTEPILQYGAYAR